MNYIIGLARNARLQHFTEFIELSMKDEFARTQTKQREVGEFMYAAQSWSVEGTKFARERWSCASGGLGHAMP